MLYYFKKNWRIYLIEAWALAMFMISASLFTVFIFHPESPIQLNISSDFVKRMLIGIAMGLTAVILIYSNWGKKSGTHINPAVTLAQFQLDRIGLADAIFYIIFQFVGGSTGVAIVYLLLPEYLSHPVVNFAVTTPKNGDLVAFMCEFLLSFSMLTMVLTISNFSKLAPYTGYFVGLVVAMFITFEAPFSGMSMNPARTFSSAVWANVWTSIWIYFMAPILGMQTAAWLFRKQYFRKNGECNSMKMHLSGEKNDCQTYEVLKSYHK
jgi:aquaporin Z